MSVCVYGYQWSYRSCTTATPCSNELSLEALGGAHFHRTMWHLSYFNSQMFPDRR